MSTATTSKGRATNTKKPCNIGVFTAKKINDWINYCTQIYRQVEQENAENSKKVADFLKSIENEPVSWERRNYAKGTITRNGLRFTFYIEKGHLSFELSLSYRGTADYDIFAVLITAISRKETIKQPRAEQSARQDPRI